MFARPDTWVQYAQGSGCFSGPQTGWPRVNAPDGSPIHLSRERSADVPTWRVWLIGPVIDHMGDIPITDDRYVGKVQQRGRGYVPLIAPSIIHPTPPTPLPPLFY